MVLAGNHRIFLLLLSALTSSAVRPSKGNQDEAPSQVVVLGPSAHLQLQRGLAAPAGGRNSSATAGPHRTNLCKRMNDEASGKQSLAKALKGAHLKVVSPTHGNNYIQKGANGEWSGYDFEVLKAVAAKAEFTFDIVAYKYDKGKSHEAQLDELSKKFDMVLEDNSDLASRESGGIFPIFDQLDSSLVLVSNRNPAMAEGKSLYEKTMVVAAPYGWTVWLAFAAASIVTGAVYYYLERLPAKSEEPKKEPDADKPVADEPEEDSGYPENSSHPRYYDYYYDENHPKSIGLAVYIAFMHCTTIVNFSPRTWPGRILVMSWSMLSIMFIAGYTANFANILVILGQENKMWQTIDDVIAAKASICVKGGIAEKFMHERYPMYRANVHVSEEYAIKRMAAGKCDAAIVWAVNFEVSQLKKEYNPDCFMARIGPKLTSSYGGWSAYADYTQDCTSLLRDVLHSHFLAMDEEGELQKIYNEKLLAAEQTVFTPCGAASAPSASSMSLGLSSMLGLFVFHFAGILIAAVVYFTFPGQRSPQQGG